MATAIETLQSEPTTIRPRQNWILGPWPDMLLIIATPLLTLVFVATIYPVVGLTNVWLLFTVCAIAHHFPTFARIYGDRDLLRRYRWKFTFGPLIPAGFAITLLVYAVRSGVSLDRIGFILLIPAVWDLWHFLMQHYGFMRIYDSPNAAPRRLAARMDLAICWAWYAHILVCAGGMLPDILATLYRAAAVPVVYWIDSQAYRWLTDLTWGAAWITTVCYTAYLLWCRAKGFFVSPAKILLLTITFGVMYLTYVPNGMIDRLMGWWHGVLGWSPAGPVAWNQQVRMRWNLWLGFVVTGLLHHSQYLTIVWKYNRSLASRHRMRGPAAFRLLFQGGAGMILAYIVLCLGYGALGHANVLLPWPSWLVTSVAGFVYVMGFTSVMMHYYFDGFIWKVRHKENQENLAMIESVGRDADQVPSWWSRWRASRVAAAAGTAAQLAVYFGVPLGALTFMALSYQADPNQLEPVAHLRRIVQFQERGDLDRAIAEAERAVAAASTRLRVERHLAEISPSAAHYGKLAELMHAQAAAQKALDDMRQRGTPYQREMVYRDQLRQAIETLEKAMNWNGPYNSDPTAEPQDMESQLALWQAEIASEP